MGFAHGAQPILRRSPFLRCPDILASGFFFLSFLLSFRSPTEGMAERREAVSFILSRA
jgi:hypothetical protein